MIFSKKTSLLLFIFIFTYIDISLASSRFVEVTGRAVINTEAPNIARKIALEDALYLAALEGGASISGFSSLDSLTNLTEEIVVRPATGILDYTVIDEIISDQHYEVSIRALIGQNEIRKGCQGRQTISLIAFAPTFYTNPKSPAWSQNLPATVFKNLITSISSNTNIDLINAVDTNINLNKKSYNSKNFDYGALTGSLISYKPADFSLEVEILVDVMQYPHSTSISSLTLENYLRLVTNIVVSDSMTGKAIFKTSRQGISFIGPRKTLFRSINVLSTPHKNNIISVLESTTSGLAEEIKNNLFCQRLKSIAQPSNISQSLNINLGSLQGITLGKLALAESKNTPFAVFEVVEVNQSSSRLMPLDKSRDINSFYGKELTFMEFIQ